MRRHISPDDPGGYEWRYFDSLSKDGRFALVVIFFLGSPMSTYYARVASGERVLPRDYQGVSFTLHENVDGQWRERAYAYNLYREGEFASDGSCIRIGKSSLSQTSDGWRLTLSERRLWRGVIDADITFRPVDSMPDLPPHGIDDGHTWICIAPHCDVSARVTTAGGQEIVFQGTGYHDGNFGLLPWERNILWYWGRVLPAGEGKDAFIYYHFENEGGDSQSTTVITRDASGIWQAEETDFVGSHPLMTDRTPEEKSAILISPQWRHLSFQTLTTKRMVQVSADKGWLLEGPFYNRWSISSDARSGIGEVFRPHYLTHPLWRIMMNTRLRWRSA